MRDAIGSDSGEEVVLEIANRLRAALPPVRCSVVCAVIGLPGCCLRPIRNSRSRPPGPPATPSRKPIWVDQVVQVTAQHWSCHRPARWHRGRDDLIRHAKLALRAAKRRGRGLVVRFAAEMEVDFDERRFIRRELSNALATRAFELYYQPIVKR